MLADYDTVSSTRLVHCLYCTLPVSSASFLVSLPLGCLLKRGFLECPAGVLEDLLLLLFPGVCLHRAVLLGVLAVLAAQLLALLLGGPPDGPVQLAEDVGLDGCDARQPHDTLQSDSRPTIDAVRTQDVRAFCPPARRALVQRCDVLDALARQEACALLHVRCLLLRHRLQDAVPDLAQRRERRQRQRRNGERGERRGLGEALQERQVQDGADGAVDAAQAGHQRLPQRRQRSGERHGGGVRMIDVWRGTDAALKLVMENKTHPSPSAGPHLPRPSLARFRLPLSLRDSARKSPAQRP